MAELLQNLPAAVFYSCDIFSGVQDASQAQEGQESFWICALIGLQFFTLSSNWDAYYLSLFIALILWFAPFMKYKYEKGCWQSNVLSSALKWNYYLLILGKLQLPSAAASSLVYT